MTDAVAVEQPRASPFVPGQSFYGHGVASFGGGPEQADIMPTIRTPDYPRRLRSILEEQTAGKEYNWTYEELDDYLRSWKNRADTTIAKRLAALARMASHPVAPVQLQGPAHAIVASFNRFYRYRMDVEKKGPTAVSDDFKGVWALGGFLGIPKEAWPTAPTVPRKKRIRLPTPEQIYELLHTDFLPNAKRNYENALIRYLLVWDFSVAWRFPSESHAARIDDFDPTYHTLVVREPKKNHSTRELYFEPEWMCCARNRLSLAGYLSWREKVDVGGTDALFLKPTGEPFRSKYDMSDWLTQRVQPRFPWFHGYMGRRWGVNARLIEWDYDYERVANWTGHESVDRIRRTYEHDARLHEKMYGGNWLSRAFFRPRKDQDAPLNPAREAQRCIPTPTQEGSPERGSDSRQEWNAPLNPAKSDQVCSSEDESLPPSSSLALRRSRAWRLRQGGTHAPQRKHSRKPAPAVLLVLPRDHRDRCTDGLPVLPRSGPGRVRAPLTRCRPVPRGTDGGRMIQPPSSDAATESFDSLLAAAGVLEHPRGLSPTIHELHARAMAVMS